MTLAAEVRDRVVCINEIYLAIPSASAEQKRDILTICGETNCKLKQLPGLYRFVVGEATVSAMKDVPVEDLLGRDPIKTDMGEGFRFISNKVVMAMGGGGSIGSELCLIVFFVCGLYNGMWMYAGLDDMNRIIVANAIMAVIQIAGTRLFVGRMPTSYYLIGAFLQLLTAAAIRFAYRFLHIRRQRGEKLRWRTIPTMAPGIVDGPVTVRVDGADRQFSTRHRWERIRRRNTMEAETCTYMSSEFWAY